jgi:hypothetical protein
MDMDWAPEEVIDYSLALLDEYGISATLFMTNKVELHTRAHELAIHPNFVSVDFEKHLAERLEDFPDAKGTRSHSLFYTERLRPLYMKFGLEYQSNAMMYRHHGTRPFHIAPSTLEIPLFWMDNFYIEMESGRPDYNFADLGLDEPGLKVFDFHPVHVFLNTETMDRYEEAKKHYKEPKELAAYRNTETRGTKDIFVDLLRHASAGGSAATLGEIAAEWKDKAR